MQGPFLQANILSTSPQSGYSLPGTCHTAYQLNLFQQPSEVRVTVSPSHRRRHPIKYLAQSRPAPIKKPNWIQAHVCLTIKPEPRTIAYHLDGGVSPTTAKPQTNPRLRLQAKRSLSFPLLLSVITSVFHSSQKASLISTPLFALIKLVPDTPPLVDPFFSNVEGF